MYDVAIIGGGPAGSTAGCILKKYNPDLKVVIFEREKFPRDHVGESQLPPISRMLDEMGVWDKVEAAGFPVKIGATYRWGKSPELWDFEFIPPALYVDDRPGKYEGLRKYTAFQVDRAIYDTILLDHAESLGCEIRRECKVATILHSKDHIDGLELEDGSRVEARYYIDASGHVGILRRALGIKADSPTTLQNIAIWDYWQNAEWAVEIGVGGTRIQILSLGYGWIWFIPLGPTRTSIGLIVPATYYKTCGLKYEELYAKALQEDPLVSRLIAKASSEGSLKTTKDWSFLAERHVG
jgi:flavin-dependent dehydrogenase